MRQVKRRHLSFLLVINNSMISGTHKLHKATSSATQFISQWKLNTLEGATYINMSDAYCTILRKVLHAPHITVAAISMMVFWFISQPFEYSTMWNQWRRRQYGRHGNNRACTAHNEFYVWYDIHWWRKNRKAANAIIINSDTANSDTERWQAKTVSLQQQIQLFCCITVSFLIKHFWV